METSEASVMRGGEKNTSCTRLSCKNDLFPTIPLDIDVLAIVLTTMYAYLLALSVPVGK